MSASPFTLAGRYRRMEVLGEGGMGRVWAAHDLLLGRQVAIKEMSPPPGLTAAKREELRVRVIREARAIARVDHPNVVRVIDVLHERGEPWIVMELVASRSLSEEIRQDGPLTPEQAAEVGLAVLSALRAAHASGLLHRDQLGGGRRHARLGRSGSPRTGGTGREHGQLNGTNPVGSGVALPVRCRLPAGQPLGQGLRHRTARRGRCV